MLGGVAQGVCLGSEEVTGPAFEPLGSCAAVCGWGPAATSLCSSLGPGKLWEGPNTLLWWPQQVPPGVPAQDRGERTGAPEPVCTAPDKPSCTGPPAAGLLLLGPLGCRVGKAHCPIRKALSGVIVQALRARTPWPATRSGPLVPLPWHRWGLEAWRGGSSKFTEHRRGAEKAQSSHYPGFSQGRAMALLGEPHFSETPSPFRQPP